MKSQQAQPFQFREALEAVCCVLRKLVSLGLAQFGVAALVCYLWAGIDIHNRTGSHMHYKSQGEVY